MNPLKLSNFRRYITPVVVTLALIGSFFLPNAVAGVMDSGRLDNLIIIDAQSIVPGADNELSLPKRIALASSYAEMLPLATGQVMEMETAQTRAVREITKLFSEGLFEFITEGYAVTDGAASLIIDTEDPTVNMIVWEFRILDRNANEVIVTIDDETGVILKLIYRRENGALNSGGSSDEDIAGLFNDEMYDVAMWLSEMMNDYYGMPVMLSDYHFSGAIAYYMVEMNNGNMITQMYGVVRSNSFTINERL